MTKTVIYVIYISFLSVIYAPAFAIAELHAILLYVELYSKALEMQLGHIGYIYCDQVLWT